MKVEELKRKYVKERYLPWLDPSYFPVNFRGTFRHISHLRKDFTTVEDDEEHIKLTALFTKEVNRGIWRKVRS